MDYLKNRDYFLKKVTEKRLKLERLKTSNEEFLKLQVRVTELGEMSSEISELCDALQFVDKAVDIEYLRFKEKRVKMLESVVTENINYIFPEKDLTAALKGDFKRNQPQIELRLIEKDGNQLIPWLSSGKLMQYLISFSATLHTLKGFGCNTLFIDEAFAASSIKNLPLIGDIFDRAAKDGTQFVVIAQNNLLYSKIPRREIHLRLKEGTSIDTVEIASISDF